MKSYFSCRKFPFSTFLRIFAQQKTRNEKGEASEFVNCSLKIEKTGVLRQFEWDTHH